MKALAMAIMFLGLGFLKAEVFQEQFVSDPASRGWKAFGETSLFHWDSLNQNLAVTWDSSKSNSYFYRALGTIVTASDDFGLAFDLRLIDVTNQGAFELAVGFLNMLNATSSNFFRGTGRDSPNLVEFDYFPAFDSFLPTLAQVIVSTNGDFLYNHNNLLELTPGDLFHVEMIYAGTNRQLSTVIRRNGVPYGSPQTITVPANFDFRIGAVSISSYSDQQADGAILAHGTVDNLSVTAPTPPIQSITGLYTNQTWEVRFLSDSNWLYQLERSPDFQNWTAISDAQPGNGTNLFLQDSQPPIVSAYYRVRAQRL